MLFGLLGDIGSDPRIIAEARQISSNIFRNPVSVDPTLAITALNVAAQNGDAAFFNQLQASQPKRPAIHKLRIQALQALASFRDAGLVVRALDYAPIVTSKKPGCIAFSSDRNERPSHAGCGMAVRSAELAPSAGPAHNLDGRLHWSSPWATSAARKAAARSRNSFRSTACQQAHMHLRGLGTASRIAWICGQLRGLICRVGYILKLQVCAKGASHSSHHGGSHSLFSDV